MGTEYKNRKKYNQKTHTLNYTPKTKSLQEIHNCGTITNNNRREQMPDIKRPNFYLLAYLFAKAGYTVINKPLTYITKKETDFITLAFDDSGERLWVSAMDMSSNKLEGIITQIRTTIQETLDIPVHVNGILITPTDTPKKTQKITYAQSQEFINASDQDSYILIFPSVASAEEYLNNNPNTPQSDSHTYLSAASNYYETITDYLNAMYCCA